MKITHVINSLATGGAERMVVELTTYGIKQGHDVTILLLQEIAGIPSVKAKELDLPTIILGGSLKDPRHIFRIRQATKDADIVHVHLFPALYWASFVRGPKVFTEHSTKNRRVDKQLFNIPERFVYGQYDRVLAISKGVVRSAEKHIANIKANTEVSLAANGIADEFFDVQRTYSCEPRKIVSIGSLKILKQHHLAIQAIAKLDNVSLKIAGEGTLRNELEALIRELNVGDRVELLGNVLDVPQLLQESDLLLSTSKFEGFSLAAGEAQATGIPVVGPNVAGFREVVLHGETGLLYEEASAGSVAECISQALEHDTYQRLAKNAVLHASKFSMSSSFDRQFEIYNDVINHHR